MAAAVWIGLVMAVGVFVWGSMPKTFGAAQGESKRDPLGRNDPQKGGNDAARL